MEIQENGLYWGKLVMTDQEGDIKEGWILMSAAIVDGEVDAQTFGCSGSLDLNQISQIIGPLSIQPPPLLTEQEGPPAPPD